MTHVTDDAAPPLREPRKGGYDVPDRSRAAAMGVPRMRPSASLRHPPWVGGVTPRPRDERRHGCSCVRTPSLEPAVELLELRRSSVALARPARRYGGHGNPRRRPSVVAAGGRRILCPRVAIGTPHDRVLTDRFTAALGCRRAREGPRELGGSGWRSWKPSTPDRHAARCGATGGV